MFEWFKRAERVSSELAMTSEPQEEALRFSGYTMEQRWQDWQSGSGPVPMLTYTSITREEAMTVPAMLKARNMIAGTIGSLPLKRTGTDNKSLTLGWLGQMDNNRTNVYTLTWLVEDIMLFGWGWLRVTRRDTRGFPLNAERVDPLYVAIQEGRVFVNGVAQPSADMIRFDSPTHGLLCTGALALTQALKLAITASNYADSPQATGYFRPVDGEDPDPEDVKQALAAWKVARQAGGDAYIGAGLEYAPAVTRWSPAELQLMDAQQNAAIQISRITGIDAEDLGVSTTSRTYFNGVDRKQAFVNNVLATYLQAVSQRLSMGDITPQGQRVSFDLSDFLKADPQSRATTYATLIGAGVMTIDEAREAEGLPKLTAAEKSAAQPNRASVDSTNQVKEAGATNG